jgi:uncharacterized protein YbaR (Trm112 family)
MTTQNDITSHHLLSQLVCPITKGPLIYDKAGARLISPQTKKAFPIRSGVPILVREQAVSLDDDDLAHTVKS